MNFKKIILVSVFLLAILTIGSVSANDNMTEELSSIDDEVTAEIDNLNTELTEENEAEGTFADLNQLIADSKDSITLKHDYNFNFTRDEGYKNGIEINKSNMVIDGAGHTIDGKGLARMFNVTGTNVAFKNINFINGFTENEGGVLYITGDESSIINCSFTNNKADVEAAAIFIKSTDATIMDSKFINNSAIYTGAMLVKGENNIIDNCLFKDNFANISAGAVGWSYKKNGIIKNSIFINNSAVNEGGGAIFWNNATNGQIINSTFCSNTAKPHGGAIFIKNATNFQIIDSTFEDNNATDGQILNSKFEGKNETGKGGAVYWLNGNGTVINSVFNRNYADEDGGAIYLRVQNGILKDSNFTDNKAYYNGAVYLNSIEGIVYDCIFINNTATDSAGALGWVKKENGTIAYCKFADNSAPRGGAIFLNNGTEFYIRNSFFENNNAIKNGGAIFWDSGNEGRIIGCQFKNNNASEFGGAICWNNTENGYISHSQFDNNKAYDGGAIYFSGSKGTISYSSFTNNTAVSGGAIYNNGTISINSNEFANNTAIYGNDIAGNGKVKYIVGFKVDEVDNEYGKTVKIIVALTSDNGTVNNGTVSVIVNNYTYEANVINATATIEIPNLNAGSYDINITYSGDSTYDDHTENYKLIINKKDVEITGKAKSYVINYGGKYSVTVKGIAGTKVIFRLSNKVIASAITDSNGIASISLTPKMLKAAKAGKKNLMVTLDDNNYQAAASFKITINKEKTKMTAKAKAFKRNAKAKKYTITLKNSKGKAVKKVKVTLKVKGKTYKATTNAKGKATFKITKLTKRGKYTAKINFKENAYYKASSKKVKITIK